MSKLGIVSIFNLRPERSEATLRFSALHSSNRMPTAKAITSNPERLYETTHSWNSEPQNIEQEISNNEVWNRCAQSFFKNNNDRIPYFDIRYSLFQSFFFDLTDRFLPAAELNPSTLNP